MSPAPKTDAARLWRYVTQIRDAAAKWNEDPYIVAAIVLRESGAGWGKDYEPKGDPWGLHADGHGHGLVGIDDRYWKDWIAKNDVRNPSVQFEFVCKLLRDNRRYLLDRIPSLKNEPDKLRRAALSAYNAGPARVRNLLLIDRDPDAATTGGSYAAWVEYRSQSLRSTIPELSYPKGEPNV